MRVESRDERGKGGAKRRWRKEVVGLLLGARRRVRGTICAGMVVECFWSTYLYFQEVLRWTVDLLESLMAGVWEGLHDVFLSGNCRALTW